MSGRLVAASTYTPQRTSVPSISVSSWLTTLHQPNQPQLRLQAPLTVSASPSPKVMASSRERPSTEVLMQ